jgi:6-phosphofructokinase 1
MLDGKFLSDYNRGENNRRKTEVEKMPNAIVGQSGGPTSVINSSLAGVMQACQMRGAEHVYGMLHGIQGLLEEKVCNLSERMKSFINIELLKRTPSSYLGSCRYRLPEPEEDEAVFEKLFVILKKLDIRWFFYIGGNDSMDTINKLARYGQQTGSEIRFMGVPKTIDNDLMLTDHTPGYGSAAKYIGVVMKEVIRDATVYGTKYVTLVEIMGRNAGWLTAAAALARGEDCEGVDLICLPELPFYEDRFLAKVEKMQKERASVVIAVSEGIKLADGRFVCELSDDARSVDAFGHINLTGTARYLSNLVARNLPTKTRSVELSILQRCAGHLTSRTDITEAFQVGGAAAKAAFEGETAKMVALKRLSNDPYQCTTELVNISEVANYEKKVPLEWINEARTDMTQDFLSYARPLIQAELTPIYINGLTQHIVES